METEYLEFEHLPFKLTVIQALMYDRKLLLPEYLGGDLFFENNPDFGDLPETEAIARLEQHIQEALAYFQELKIPGSLADEISFLYSGDEMDVYYHINPQWLDYDEYFEDGKPYFECEVKNGLRNGPCKIYFDNGKVNIEKYYENGLLQGKARVFHPTGKLYKEFTYVDDVQSGKQVKYYPDGKVLEVAEFHKGFLNGVCKVYTPNGDLRSECTYKDDKLVGDKIIYHPNGTIALISPHKDGKPNGVTKKFSDTGELMEEWFFEDGILTLKKTR